MLGGFAAFFKGGDPLVKWVKGGAGRGGEGGDTRQPSPWARTKIV